MILIFGQRVCGRVDDVPGICYVATRFFHLYYVPLIPLSSWVIVKGTKNSSIAQEQRIRLSGKSILFGWLQAFLIVFGGLNTFRGAIQLATLPPGNDATDGTFRLALGLFCFVAWLLFQLRPFRAGHERANELRGHLGIEPTVADDHFGD